MVYTYVLRDIFYLLLVRRDISLSFSLFGLAENTHVPVAFSAFYDDISRTFLIHERDYYQELSIIHILTALRLMLKIETVDLLSRGLEL